MNYLNRWVSPVAVVCTTILAAQHSRAENRSRQAAPATHETENSPAATTIRALEQRAEEATVSGDTAFLETVFASDFTYARTAGEVENKAQWLQHVARKPFISRKIVAMVLRSTVTWLWFMDSSMWRCTTITADTQI